MPDVAREVQEKVARAVQESSVWEERSGTALGEARYRVSNAHVASIVPAAAPD